jgi:hypothetical protein
MPDLTQALVVPFAAGFIVQRFLEILDPFISSIVPDPNKKKIVMSFASLVIGLALSGIGGIEIFKALNWQMNNALDICCSGIFISAGTEGFNSLMKFANYKKEASKADAADKKSKLTGQQLNLVNPQQ